MTQPLLDKKRPPGRPAEMKEGRKVYVYLDASSIETARRLGNGNLSEGIRIALRNFSESQSPPAAVK